MERGNNLLILTPSLTGGGWNAFYRFTKYIATRKNITTYIIGAGKKDLRFKKKIHQLILPYFDYNRHVHKLESSELLNILFNLPFMLFSFTISPILLISKRKNSISLSNGLLSSIPAIISKLFIKNLRVYSWLHTDAQFHKSDILRKFVFFCSKYIDVFFVNSEDIKNDLNACGVSNEKITIIKNWVDRIDNFPDMINEFKEKYKIFDKYKFRVLYVGRFVQYKHFPLYLNVARKLASEEVAFIFVGDGELHYMAQEAASKTSNIFVLRGVSDEELRYLYSIANITLTYADETYLSLTALESLSMGTPIIYADISVSPAKYYKKVKIKRELVPKDIGFKVEASVEKISELIKSLKNANFPTDNLRAKCKEHINLNYSEKNAEMIANILGIGGDRVDENR